jgi:putative two-component system response regulator
MKQHPTVGCSARTTRKRPILKTAVMIAHQHREKIRWHLLGAGAAGQDIHRNVRVVAAAVDVFAALSHVRCYKKA